MGALIVTPSIVDKLSSPSLFVFVKVAGSVSQLRIESPSEHDTNCMEPLDATLMHVCGPPGWAQV